MYMSNPHFQITATMPSWKSLGESKREAILQLIPQKWRLQGPIPPANEQPDVTGSYVQQFLSPSEIEITEVDAIEIAQRTTSGHWTAVEVTEAFCHRAAIAHQLVCVVHNLLLELAFSLSHS